LEFTSLLRRQATVNPFHQHIALGEDSRQPLAREHQYITAALAHQP